MGHDTRLLVKFYAPGLQILLFPQKCRTLSVDYSLLGSLHSSRLDCIQLASQLLDLALLYPILVHHSVKT